jgi:UDP-arabinose 4-epimerase
MAGSNSKTILVTGGAGYIGAHTCKALSSAGFEPVSYDNLSRGNADAVLWGPFEQGDILDREHLGDVIDRYRPAAVIHFAALAYVSESVASPGKYWHNNVTGSLTLVEAMRSRNINQFVFSSSCAVYGESPFQPICEDAPKRPVNPYGRSKLVVEKLLQDCHPALKLNSVSLRYFNAAGADLEREIGEKHEPETHLIPLALNSVINPDQPITVFGADYPTADGTCIRDFVHVSDLADAHVKALDYLHGKPGVHQFNLGTGQGFSVLQVIEAVGQVTGVQPNVKHGPRRPGDPPVLVADPVKANQELDWKPRYCKIQEMVESAWGWLNRR